jgi:phosphoglycolate phosphatase
LPPRVQAVVFDFDNTLIESRVDFVRMRQRVQDYIRERHPKIPVEDARTTMELLSRLESLLGQGEVNEALEEINRIMDLTEMESEAKARLLGSVLGVLSALREMGLKIGLLTRSCREYTELVARREGIIEFFDAISCRSQGEPLKPDPRALTSLCELLGVEPERILLVGDHAMDGECAIAAGALFVGVTTGSSSRQVLEELGPLAVLDDLTDLPPLIEGINHPGSRGA